VPIRVQLKVTAKLLHSLDARNERKRAAEKPDVNHLVLTETSKTRSAQALVVEDAINTRGSILTRIRRTLVQVYVTCIAGPPIVTAADPLNLASCVCTRALGASTAVHARRRFALDDISACFPTVIGLVTWMTHTFVNANAKMNALCQI
jgi:hypothetical protein